MMIMTMPASKFGCVAYMHCTTAMVTCTPFCDSVVPRVDDIDYLLLVVLIVIISLFCSIVKNMFITIEILIKSY